MQTMHYNQSILRSQAFTYIAGMSLADKLVFIVLIQLQGEKINRNIGKRRDK